MNCRHCQAVLVRPFLDLGFSPPSNAYLGEEQLSQPERYFPLRLKVCERCWLVQTEDYSTAEDLFSASYAYFSSTSASWLAHAAAYSEGIIARLGLDSTSFVVEVAANDGYLLKNFVRAGIPCLGIEPTASTADAAERQGIAISRRFFGRSVAVEMGSAGKLADLIIGNNVYAHVPDINDFTAGLKAALKPQGTITLEFPHLLRLVQQSQFDTVYHEHFSYLSLYSVGQIFASAGLRIVDVEELSTHGGSLRVYGAHSEDPRSASSTVEQVLTAERDGGLLDIELYSAFQERADRVKNDLLRFLLEQHQAGKSVAAYGAAAKGNTILNYAGVKPDLVSFVCDAAPSKQHMYMPGSHIPILPPEALRCRRPDFVLILPWNIAAEVRTQHAYISEWGGRFVTAIPNLSIVD